MNISINTYIYISSQMQRYNFKLQELSINNCINIKLCILVCDTIPRPTQGQYQ